MPVMSLTVFGLAAVLVIGGVSVSVALTLASALVLVVFAPVPLDIIPLTIWSGLESYVMTAVPLFMLAGLLMESGGLATRLFSFVESLFSWMRGGVGHVNVAASLLFSGISGSSIADVAALGKLEMDLMNQNGYKPDYSAAMTAISSTLAVLVPPSIMMVLVGVLSRQSIAAMLLGGVGPGVLLAIVLMTANHFISIKQGIPRGKFPSPKVVWTGFWSAAPVLLIPVFLMVGMISGTFTPTEVAAVAVIYSIFIALFLYKELTFSTLLNKFVQTTKTTGSILFILAGSTMFSWIISWDSLADIIAQMIGTLTQSPIVVLLILEVVLVLVGMFIDTAAALIILVPLLFPVGLNFGIHPIHLGVVMVVSMSIGLVTPPYGLCLFSTAVVSELPLERIVRALAPLLVVTFISLIIVAVFPAIVTYLPTMLLG